MSRAGARPRRTGVPPGGREHGCGGEVDVDAGGGLLAGPQFGWSVQDLHDSSVPLTRSAAWTGSAGRAP